MTQEHARRKELRNAFEQIKTFYGVVKVTNTRNGKFFITSFTNIKNKEGYLWAQLDDGRHPNAALQADWRTFGADAFAYEVLESHDAADVGNVAFEAKQLEKHYLEALEPFGEKGYNKPPRS
ncbi:MAG: GIY-YIG nuclease family protein [Coriobacteriaceae bacterium]|jgi:hypothetical protein|nr:GIY-YIG nuclease family protein [Coriobacteriaceae bacterium]